MRKIFYLICVAVFITICAAGCGNNDNDDAFDPAKVKRYDYVLDESSSHVQNIPFDKYLSAVSAPSDAVNASEYGLAADGDYIGNTVALQAAVNTQLLPYSSKAALPCISSEAAGSNP